MRFVVDVGCEVSLPGHEVRHLIERAVVEALESKTSKESLCQIYVHKCGPLDEAIASFGQAIRDAADAAVSERIR